jgi:large subunit ribosomal protein L4
MISVTLKKLDFSSNSLNQKKFDLESVDMDSPKSIAYVLRWQLAKKRSGSAKTKTMSEISGTTAKPWKQKGTGRARQGSRRSVQFVGGRTCHGPLPRSFDFSMPKKIISKALSDVVKLRIKEGKLMVFSNFGSEIKTAKIKLAISKVGCQSALIVHDNSNNVLQKSTENLKNAKYLNIENLNVYDILNFDHLFIEEGIFESKVLGAIV